MKPLIPTNVITGFLGVGKTTAITHLLKHKPKDEIWSVLVNEFGEIGIDGAMLKSVNAYVREVPGGCICCVAGLPMKIALNMMIAKTRPDRIIIEPTGLGHPEEIINTLLGEYYDTVLDVRATITLVDPRKLNDSRYLDNSTFNDQISVADVLVANKTDVCNAEDKQLFSALAASFDQPKQSFWVEQGRLDCEWLNFARVTRDGEHPQHHQGDRQTHQQKNRLSPQRELYNSAVKLPQGERFIRRENSADGFYSCGWLFQPEIQFNFNQLFGWLSGADFLRAKAVMHTNEGLYMFNSENDVLSVNQIPVQSIDDILDSRIEVIDDKKIPVECSEAILLGTIIVKNFAS